MGYIDNLIQFSAGSKALASEVNQNFEVLKNAVNDSVKKDGSVAFIAEVAGVTPTKIQSIATKGYVDSSSNKLLSQCVNLARTTNGQADFITVGSGLKPKILALTTNLTGNCQYKDIQNKFSINSDVDLPNNAPINRRSTIIYKNWTDNPAWAYACQRQQWGEVFDSSKNLLMDFSSSLTLDKYGNTVTVLGNPTLSGDKYVGDGTGDGLKITSIVSLGSDKWCIEGKFKFNNTNASMSLIEGINGSYYSIRLIRNSSNRLELYASSNSSTYNIANVVLGSKADWSTSTEYYIKLKVTGTQYIASWSTDGITYTDDLTVTSSLNIAGFDSNGLVFGIDGFNNTLSFNGTMDDLRVTIGNTRADGEAFTPDAYWYDTANKIMKYGSPASWTELSECVALGEVTTNATTVISAVSYALNGKAISPILTGTNNTILNFNDNIGHTNKRVIVRSRFNAGYQWSYQSLGWVTNHYGYSPNVKNDLASSAGMYTSSNYVAAGSIQGLLSFPDGSHSTGDVQIIVERIDS
jgi:hypothetical protein